MELSFLKSSAVDTAIRRGYKTWQMDVKTAFLKGNLYEEIHMSQPKGFIEKGQEQKVCRLLKSIYGLK